MFENNRKRTRPEKAGSRESGMIVVETIISFTAFIMVCLGITFMINVFTVHNKVQFAINSAAREIASYGYFYDALELLQANRVLDKDSQNYTADIDKTVNQVADTLDKMQSTLDDVNGTVSAVQNIEFSENYYTNTIATLSSLKTNAGDTWESGKQSVTDIKDLFSDPKGLLVGVMYVGMDGAVYVAKNLVGMGAAYVLTEKYLTDGVRDADAYLRSYGVANGYDGLDFGASTVFADGDNRMVDIVVEYDIDLSFINFVLPSAKIHVVQRASVAGWAGGDHKRVPEGLG